MEIQNKGFMIYADRGELISDLSKEEAGELLFALMDYAFGGKEPEGLCPVAKTVFRIMKREIDRDYKKYTEKVDMARRAREIRQEKLRAAKADTDINADISVDINADINTDIISENSIDTISENNDGTNYKDKDKANDKDKGNDNDKAKDNAAGGVRGAAQQIIQSLNNAAGTRYRAENEGTRRLIKARLDEGYTKEELISTAEKMCRIWKGTRYEQFLRPETLFGEKFESYLNRPEYTERSAAQDESAATKAEYLRSIEEHMAKTLREYAS